LPLAISAGTVEKAIVKSSLFPAPCSTTNTSALMTINATVTKGNCVRSLLSSPMGKTMPFVLGSGLLL
jgi:hypothetical protein